MQRPCPINGRFSSRFQPHPSRFYDEFMCLFPLAISPSRPTFTVSRLNYCTLFTLLSQHSISSCYPLQLLSCSFAFISESIFHISSGHCTASSYLSHFSFLLAHSGIIRLTDFCFLAHRHCLCWLLPYYIRDR
jgi:hypothetical protein